MILHCVFLRFKAALQPADKQAIFEAVDVKYGPNVSPEGLNGGFVDGFTVTFDDAAARDAYLVHPEHVAVGERIIAATDGGLAGILVFDLMI